MFCKKKHIVHRRELSNLHGRGLSLLSFFYWNEKLNWLQ